MHKVDIHEPCWMRIGTLDDKRVTEGNVKSMHSLTKGIYFDQALCSSVIAISENTVFRIGKILSCSKYNYNIILKTLPR